MIDPAVGLILALAFATLFATAALHKLRDLAGFDAAFVAYGLTPAAARVRWSRSVPLAELLVAIGLILGAARSDAPRAGAIGAAAAASGAGLLLLYAAAIGLNLRRGRRELSCGCGGPGERRPIAAWMVWRNLALALALLASFVPWRVRAWTLTDGVTVLLGVAVVSVLYLSLDQLGEVARRAAALRSPS